MTGKRYKSGNLMTRTQKWMGSVGCFGQNKNKKRQSYVYRMWGRAVAIEDIATAMEEVRRMM